MVHRIEYKFLTAILKKHGTLTVQTAYAGKFDLNLLKFGNIIPNFVVKLVTTTKKLINSGSILPNMELITITMQNPWWKNRDEILKDEKVEKALNSNPQYTFEYRDENIILLGPRQVGKTTYIKLVIRDLLLYKNIEPRNILYLTCDFINDKDDIKIALNFFDDQSNKSNKRYIFLDEISFVKDWNVLILGLFNSGYLRDKNIYLTGSSSISLLKETFPGRNIIKTIFLPLQFKEYFDLFYGKIWNDANISIENIDGFYRSSLNIFPYIEDLNRALKDYIYTGGFLWPAYLHRNGKDPINELYEVYSDSFISDIAKLDKSQRFFKEIVGQLISGYGSRLSANSISQNTSIGSHKTVEEYLEIMEQLFMVKIFNKKIDNKIMYRSNKKIYFIDPFIYRVMKMFAAGEPAFRENEESKVIDGIAGMHLYNIYHDIYYVQTNKGKEIDFIYKDIGVEVKYGNKKLSKLYSEKGYLLTNNDIPKKENDKVSIPLSIFLYLLGNKNALK